MIAVDTNLLVYAHREDSPWHEAAYARISGLAEARAPWAVPWPCVHEFLAIVTHPRIYAPPTPLAAAIDQVEAWLESPSVTLLAESEGYWPEVRSLLLDGRMDGAPGPRRPGRCAVPPARRSRIVDRGPGFWPLSRIERPQSAGALARLGLAKSLL